MRNDHSSRFKDHTPFDILQARSPRFARTERTRPAASHGHFRASRCCAFSLYVPGTRTPPPRLPQRCQENRNWYVEKYVGIRLKCANILANDPRAPCRRTLLMPP